MASKFHLNQNFLILFSLIFTLETKAIQANFNPNAFVLPVYKDENTSLYITKIRMRTPQVLVPFLVDLNGKFLWVDCEKTYFSSTYNVPFCHSTLCSIAGNHYCNKCTSIARPGCHNNTCAIITTNQLIRKNVVGEIASDVLSVQSMQGSNAGQVVTIPNFIFTCAPSSLVQGQMPRNVQGIVGLGHTPVDLPFQLSAHLGIPPQFTLCLPSSTNKEGAIFIGKTPRAFGINIDPSKSIVYTPLMIGAEGEYFIQVRSIRINNKAIQLKRSLLSSNRGFITGTMLSTIAPFTVHEHSVFKTFINIFAHQFSSVRQVKGVFPFEACFDSSKLRNTKIQPQVPNIEFVMQNQNVTWTISGANSMVQVRPGVSCLAFVNGGNNTKSPIVIGAYQLQDHLLQFDIVRSRIGLSYSLMSQGTSCANFNFTSSFISEMD